jgi:hypothetical protein
MSKSKAAFQAEHERIERIWWQGLTPEERAAAVRAVDAADSARPSGKGNGRTGRPKKWSVGVRRDLAARFLAAWNQWRQQQKSANGTHATLAITIQDAKGRGGFNTKWAVAFVLEHYGIHRAAALAILQKIRAKRATY